jgi:hypothetical protein
MAYKPNRLESLVTLCENLKSRTENYVHHKPANLPFSITGSRSNSAAFVIIDAIIKSEWTVCYVGNIAILGLWRRDWKFERYAVNTVVAWKKV